MLMLLKELLSTVIQYTISLGEILKLSIPSSLLINSLMERNFNFNDVHVTAAKRVAEAVVKYNVSRLIHVSSYNADPTSESQFYASKVLPP